MVKIFRPAYKIAPVRHRGLHQKTCNHYERSMRNALLFDSSKELDNTAFGYGLFRMNVCALYDTKMRTRQAQNNRWLNELHVVQYDAAVEFPLRALILL